MPDLKLGLLCWNQNTEWPALLQAGIRADQLGYDSLWAWDHLYPIVGDPHGPFYEGWLTLTAWAMATRQIKLGLMVGANPYRYPTVVAKMATTLDHISNGRVYLGIGGAWFAGEAHDFGVDFGSGFPDRLRWLGEALPLMRGMLDGTEPSSPEGGHYHAHHVRNDPLPVQKHLPILVGGGGEKVTLKLVAQYADANNVGDGLETVRRKEEVLRQHLEDAGRPSSEVERTVGVGIVVVRDTRAEAEKVLETFYENNRMRPWEDQPIGTPEDVAEALAPYLELGYHHLIVGHPAPYDEESETRLAKEVRPLLEKAL